MRPTTGDLDALASSGPMVTGLSAVSAKHQSKCSCRGRNASETNRSTSGGRSCVVRNPSDMQTSSFF